MVYASTLHVSCNDYRMTAMYGILREGWEVQGCVQGEKGSGRMEKSISPIQLMSCYRRTQLVSCARKWTPLTVSYNLQQTDTTATPARPPAFRFTGVSGSPTEPLEHRCYCMVRLLQPFKPWSLLYVAPGSEFKESTSCPWSDFCILYGPQNQQRFYVQRKLMGRRPQGRRRESFKHLDLREKVVDLWRPLNGHIYTELNVIQIDYVQFNVCSCR
jgi:hypothetical protein